MEVNQVKSIHAAALINEEPMNESSESDEYDVSYRNRKNLDISATQQLTPHPFRRQHLKFGVLGKRYSYGYLGKRTDVPKVNNDIEEWVNDIRERRAGRPQYGMLG
ncbi:unnamed protein product [Rotaria sp. Silwood2]|nr:unnamed protein product [Rotaria sp. Silwood2]CAF2839979.1 unnamed protein product [Rotaria sp. Silwood2]CAF2988533.1 unnamed protein product [Rotaria sp. Silwood2]CAF4041298.1 unnamed protein product [Rotaria sp. Silwood2]CAF4137018.1 unnamed protein product [Rotaria sp. Silwood2]